MNHKLNVTRGQLSELLTTELQLYSDAEGSKITIKHLFETPDSEGCNWSGIQVQAGPNATKDIVESQAFLVESAARNLYTVVAG